METDALQERIDKLREQTHKSFTEKLDKQEGPSGEDAQEHKRREDELTEIVSLFQEQKKSDDASVDELKSRIGELEKQPAFDPQSVQAEVKEGTKSYDGNYFMDKKAASKGDGEAAKKLVEYESQWKDMEVEAAKAWSSSDLETNNLILPDVKDALVYLAAQAKTAALCNQQSTNSSSVIVPEIIGPLTVSPTTEGATKPASDPTFASTTYNVFTYAGTTQVPNQTLEDYPAARSWISSELGRSAGVELNRQVLAGNGVGEPTGLMNHGTVGTRAATDVGSDGNIDGRDIIEGIYRCVQDVRADGFTEPTDIVMHPSVWTDIVLFYSTNYGYLLGSATSQTGPEGEVRNVLHGLPVTLDANQTTAYGSTSNESPVIVGNFNDAVIWNRSPLQIDVDTSLGFRDNTTWFRGEGRAAFGIVRPLSFCILTNIVPGA